MRHASALALLVVAISSVAVVTNGKLGMRRQQVEPGSGSHRKRTSENAQLAKLIVSKLQTLEEVETKRRIRRRKNQSAQDDAVTETHEKLSREGSDNSTKEFTEEMVTCDEQMVTYDKQKSRRCFTSTGMLQRIEKNLATWQSHLLLPNTNISWLVLQDDGTFLCNACHKFGYTKLNPLRNGLKPTPYNARLGHFRRHEKCNEHVLAATALANCVEPGAVDHPNVDQLNMVRKDLRSHTLPGSYAWGGRIKIRQCIWAIAEAVRLHKINHWYPHATSAALHHDGGGGSMFVRMSASLKFKRISGYVHVVDMVKNFGNADSMSIAQAIKQAVKNACTKNLHVPHKSEEWHAENTECCTDTYETFTKNVSLLNADAASDEKKAMDILGSDALLVDVPEEHVCRPKIEAVANTFPGILCQHEDKAHASTRLTQRGWAAVPECRDVYARMIGSTTSPTRIIQNSPQWQKTHSDIILGEKIWQGKTVSELGMAPHRFNSSSKPMIRNVINVRAVCGQAQVIWQTRGASSHEGQSMLSFASWVQTFHLMLLSFMCDGGCETLKVTRTVEPEDADLGDWASCTETFLKTCIVLFEHKRAQFVGFGEVHA